MKLTDMQYTKAETKKRNSSMKEMAVEDYQPEYPWGLEITLNDKCLKKLDIDVKDCNVKDKVKVVAECSVKDLRSHASARNSSDDRMELQIEKLGIEKPQPKKMKGKSYADYKKYSEGGPG